MSQACQQGAAEAADDPGGGTHPQVGALPAPLPRHQRGIFGLSQHFKVGPDTFRNVFIQHKVGAYITLRSGTYSCLSYIVNNIL